MPRRHRCYHWSSSRSRRRSQHRRHSSPVPNTPVLYPVRSSLRLRHLYNELIIVRRGYYFYSYERVPPASPN